MHVPQEIEMSISPPHGPIHEEIEFWYDPNEKALLYEVNPSTGASPTPSSSSGCGTR